MSLRPHPIHSLALIIRLAMCCVVCLFAAATHARGAPTRGAPAASEYDLRAAIIYRLLQYSQWELIDETRLNICTTGNGEGDEAFQKLNNEILRNDILISVDTLQKATMSHCDVIVLGPKDEIKLKPAYANYFFICNGCEKNVELAALNLFLKNDRLLYDVNRTVAERIKVHFKSAILKSANRVRGNDE